MKKRVYVFIATSALSLGAVCQTLVSSNINSTYVYSNTNGAVASTYTFVADAGVRQVDASNPGVKMNDAGALTLLYENRNGGGSNTVESDESSDWLSFKNVKTGVNPDNFRAVQLPDGTWRSYGLDTTKGITGSCLKSQTSTDGVHFTPDEGCRYELPAQDQGRMGVYDFFNDQQGGVVMLYLGDLMGKNNVRRAYSTDNGWTFVFDRGNVFDDDNAGGGGNTYVDQKTVTLPDGSIYLVAMKSGSIYSFVSQDGQTFSALGKILSPADFMDVSLHSLHDPQIIRLPDGRLRLYVTGVGETSMIVSATSQ